VLSNSTRMIQDETLNLTSFAPFYERLFPVITPLLEQDKVRDTVFAQQWKNAVSQDPNKITATSFFRTLAKALKLQPSNVGAFVSFLKTCPGITQQVEIRPSPSGGTSFLYRFLQGEAGQEMTMNVTGRTPTTSPYSPNHQISIANDLKTDHDNDTITMVQSQPPNSAPSLPEFTSCYSNTNDFTIMLTAYLQVHVRAWQSGLQGTVPPSICESMAEWTARDCTYEYM